MCSVQGVIMLCSLRLQRRADLLGGGWLEEPVSEQVSEVSQLGCDVCTCCRPRGGVWGPGDACRHGCAS